MATTLAGRAPDRGLIARVRAKVDLRWYAASAALLTYGMIVLGGTVRATDSGQACPDWPLCKGHVIPPLEAKVWVEFTHRLVATLITFVLIGLIYGVWRRRHEDPLLWKLAIASGVVLLVQILLGGATVNSGNAAWSVAMHLSVALTFLTVLIIITARLFRPADHGILRPEVLPVVVLAGVFALVISGAFVSQKHAGLAYPDWPLFDGGVTPADSEAGWLHYVHRLIAGSLGLLYLGLFITAIRAKVDSRVIWLLTLAGVLIAAQALVGALNVWLELATSVRILHLALASAVWGVLAFTMAWAYQNGLRLTKGSS
ncbi:MAG: COX15/CtaA family protein [Chloroflexota bacterium]